MSVERTGGASLNRYPPVMRATGTTIRHMAPDSWHGDGGIAGTVLRRKCCVMGGDGWDGCDGWGEIKSKAIQRDQAFGTIYPLVN